MQLQPNDYGYQLTKEKIDPLSNIHISRYTPPSSIAFLHYHTELELGLCLEGSGIFIIGEKYYKYAAGDISVICPHELHFAQSDSDNLSTWHFLTISLENFRQSSLSALYEKICNGTLSGKVIPGNHYPYMQSLIRLLYHEQKRHAEYYDIVTNSLIPAALVHSERILSTPDEHQIQNTQRIGELLPALKYIAIHFASPIDIPHLAALCHCSVTQLRRLFNEIIGEAPLTYWHKARIYEAIRRLKETSDSITQIAYDIGYETISSFNRHFKEIMGASPSLYRKSEGNTIADTE